MQATGYSVCLKKIFLATLILLSYLDCFVFDYLFLLPFWFSLFFSVVFFFVGLFFDFCFFANAHFHVGIKPVYLPSGDVYRYIWFSNIVLSCIKKFGALCIFHLSNTIINCMSSLVVLLLAEGSFLQYTTSTASTQSPN